MITLPRFRSMVGLILKRHGRSILLIAAALFATGLFAYFRYGRTGGFTLFLGDVVTFRQRNGQRFSLTYKDEGGAVMRGFSNESEDPISFSVETALYVDGKGRSCRLLSIQDPGVKIAAGEVEHSIVQDGAPVVGPIGPVAQRILDDKASQSIVFADQIVIKKIEEGSTQWEPPGDLRKAVMKMDLDTAYPIAEIRHRDVTLSIFDIEVRRLKRDCD